MVIITAPSLDTNKNVSGISSVTSFIIATNSTLNYKHFQLGKRDNEKRGILTFFRILKVWIKWVLLLESKRDLFIHFNFSLDIRSIIRDTPLILYARFRHKKMVIHLHGGEYLEKESIPIWISKILSNILSKNEPKIVLSPIEKMLIEKKYNGKNIYVLPNCIDIKEALVFKKKYSTKAPIKLLFIGRIVSRKGIEYILEALEILKCKNIIFKFILAGAGPSKDDMVKKYSEVLGNAFEFKGIVSGRAKFDLIKECDVFLLPSIKGEGLPIALLECMSFGVVPLVTVVG
jgi:glycosyltransferase involved in cell wall biosynthesis